MTPGQKEARPQTWESGRAMSKDVASIADYAALAAVALGALGLVFGAVHAWRFGGFPICYQTVTAAAMLAGGLLWAVLAR